MWTTFKYINSKQIYHMYFSAIKINIALWKCTLACNIKCSYEKMGNKYMVQWKTCPRRSSYKLDKIWLAGFVTEAMFKCLWFLKMYEVWAYCF